MNPLVYVFITVISTVTGQFFIKSGVTAISQHYKGNFLLQALLNPSIIIGFVLAFTAAVSWIFAMRTLPLAYAYPFTALSLILVPIGAHIIYKEPITTIHWVSLVLIVAGVLILSLQKS